MKVEVTCHSRQSKDNSGSKLLHQIFQIICQIKARPDINLFASRLLADLPWYVAWRPDPYSKKRVQCNKFGPIITLIFPHLFNEKQSFSKDWDKVEKMVIVTPHMAVSRLVPGPSNNVNREIYSLTTTPV